MNPLAELTQYADCETCPLKAQREKGASCPGRGPRVAVEADKLPIMFVGEGPGRNEVKDQSPFVGKSGRLLAQLCKVAGFDFDACHVTNATLCSLEGYGEFPVEAVKHCLGRLEYEVHRARPRVIVAAGAAALLAVTGELTRGSKWEPFTCPVCGDPETRSKKCEGCAGKKRRLVEFTSLTSEHKISAVAGALFRVGEESWLHEHGVRFIVPIYHPSFIMRQPETAAQKKVGGQFVAPATVAHLQKAYRVAREEPVWKFHHKVTTDWRVVAEYVQRGGTFAIDIETDSKTPLQVTTIKCIGLARIGDEETLVVDTRHADPMLLDVLGQFLADAEYKKILQNRNYDEVVIDLVWGVVVRGTIGDTLLGHRAVWPDEPHKLGPIAFRYTDSPPWKPARQVEEIDTFKSDEDFWLYNGRDARNTAFAWPPILNEVRGYGLERVLENDMAMASIAIDMQINGMPGSRARVDELRNAQRKIYDEQLASLREACGLKGLPDFNPNSPKQLQWALYAPDGIVQLEGRVKTKSGKKNNLQGPEAYSTGKIALTRIDHPWVRDLKALRLAKRALDQIANLEGGMDERAVIHPIWKSYGARSGRWSSANPSVQNLLDFVRVIVEAPVGYQIVGADYAQLEMRVNAMLSQDKNLIRRCLEADESRKFDPNFDPHSYVASVAFGSGFTHADDRTKKTLRDISKRIYYGSSYAGGAKTISENIMADDDYTGPFITEDMAKKVLAAIFRAYPGVLDYRHAAEAEARRDANFAIKSPFLGRRRVFPLGDIPITELANWGCQSGAADITDRAMGLIHQRLPDVDSGAWIMAQVHDAIYVVCRDERVDAVKKLLAESMYYEHMGMKFVATPKASRVWSEVS